jgi:hypothetical protein
MTKEELRELQLHLDAQRKEKCKIYEADLRGQMPWCVNCKYESMHKCKIIKEKRIEENACAVNYLILEEKDKRS